MVYLMDILIGAASRIVMGELSSHLEPMARWIIDKAVECLPACQRERFREEWMAHLDETPGLFRKLLHAIGCRLAASALANIPAPPATATTQSNERERHFRRFLTMMGKPDAELEPWQRELGRMLPWDDLTREGLLALGDALIKIADAKPGTRIQLPGTRIWVSKERKRPRPRDKQ
jgi:hypothetical protein